MTERYDAIIVGGGHNGLVCAAYLARGGKRTLVLEAADEVGGAAVTRELAPGYRVSACAHIVHMLHPQVAADLALEAHGLRWSSADMPTVALGEDGRHLVLGSDPEATAASVRSHAPEDAAALASLQTRLDRFAAVLQPLFGSLPPRLGSRDWTDRKALLGMGLSLRRLGREDMRELLRIALMNVADLLEDTLATPLLRGALAFDAVLGTRLGPRSPSTVFTLLYRLAGQSNGIVNGKRARLRHPVGGMGALSNALAAAARSAGAEIRTAAPVAHIRVADDRACGVVLESGEELASRSVISNADPRRTFLHLLGAEHLDTGFVRRVRNIRMRGTAAKLNLALEALPEFRGVERSALAGRLLVAPDVDYVERAFNPVKYGEHSQEPVIELTIPSLHDSSLASEGRHVLSAVVQYAPSDLRAGWEAAGEAFAARVIDRIARYAPDLPGKIAARQLLTPLDLERDFALSGGHWHHGELALDQFLMMRPVPGAARYATPLPGLYLCGAGAHPGGGIMGAAGMNAARCVLDAGGRA